MSNTLLLWSFPVAIAVHNLEEAIWLPAWARASAGRWHKPVGPRPFRFAVSVLTLFAFGIAAWSQASGVGSLGHYLLASYALGQGLNVVFPHLVATIATRSYAPGLLTGVFFVLPSASGLLVRAFSEGQLKPERFVLTAAVFIPLVISSIPLLFRIGRRLER